MSESHWRNHAAPIIAGVIAAHPDGVGLPKALREAYPFGERKYQPYKIWLDEVARQMKRKPPLGTRAGRVHGSHAEDPNQLGLFAKETA